MELDLVNWVQAQSFFSFLFLFLFFFSPFSYLFALTPALLFFVLYFSPLQPVLGCFYFFLNSISSLLSFSSQIPALAAACREERRRRWLGAGVHGDVAGHRSMAEKVRWW
jgi:hypothetical protein